MVPTIGNGEGPVWREACPPPCDEELARTGGLRLMRSGEPGIASEWVLRMPVGKTFDLRPRPLLTQDILDQQPQNTFPFAGFNRRIIPDTWKVSGQG